ncbi:LysR family transcriptional regulator ArgP [Pseudomonas sp. TE21394]
MNLIHPQIAAFTAVLEESTFEAAARRLSVTPSAVSQRIKALEDRIGQVLVVRQTPCKPTPAGERLLRRVRPMQILEAEALADFLPDKNAATFASSIPIAVNEDSLSTWLIRALADLHLQSGFVFDVQRDDQDHTLEFLKDGTVLGVITSEAEPLQGCEVHPLGIMRYHAIASPEFAARYFSSGMNAMTLAKAPMIVYDRKDDLQWRFIRKITRARLNPPVHYLPTAIRFIEASERNMGWCIAAEGLFEEAASQNRVVNIAPAYFLDVPIYWQHAAVRSTTLQKITKAMQAAAATMLRQRSGEA